MSGCGLKTLTDLKVLSNLRKLICRDNGKDYAYALCPFDTMLMGAYTEAITQMSAMGVITFLEMLQEADFSGNPCCKVRRYRDYVIGVSADALEVLDEQPILSHQRVAIKGLQVHRTKIGADMSMSVSLDEEQSLSQQSLSRSATEDQLSYELHNPVRRRHSEPESALSHNGDDETADDNMSMSTHSQTTDHSEEAAF